MLASFPASMVNQKLTDLGIPNRFKLNSSRFRATLAEDGGDTMLPRIAMMKALHRHLPRSEAAPRRKRARSYKIVR